MIRNIFNLWEDFGRDVLIGCHSPQCDVLRFLLYVYRTYR